MRSFLLLSLVGAFAAHAGAHVLDHSYRVGTAPSYVKASEATADGSRLRLLRRGDYVETAKELVTSATADLGPGSTFRLVQDHYVGTNGIGHVNFKQTVHGLDIENADFNVNVGVST
jgi:extracellular elastinolytic metalloproteinase